MKIVVLDGYTENPGDLTWDGMKALGDLTVYDRTSLTDEAEIIRRIGNAQAVITNKTPISQKVIDACPSIEYIGMLSTGYNVVDYAYASQKKIPVANIPSYGTEAVAQFAIALLLEICHNIGHHNEAVHQGRWEKSEDWCFWDYPLIELKDKIMGIIGFGRIGQTTGKIAQALGMKVLAYDTHCTAGIENDSCRYAQLDEVLEQSDVIALHCPLFPETEKIINRETIQKMKDGVSRGQLIDEEALADALKCGKVYAAALDVVSTEPIQSKNPLLYAPNCLITPHISWAPRESRERLMKIAVNNLKAFILGQPQNIVN